MTAPAIYLIGALGMGAARLALAQLHKRRLNHVDLICAAIWPLTVVLLTTVETVNLLRRPR